jgi:hypothetical protein
MYKSIDINIDMSLNNGSSENEVTKIKRKPYDWKLFMPKGCNVTHCLKWFLNGISEESKMSNSQLTSNMTKLARMLSLLQEYEDR